MTLQKTANIDFKDQSTPTIIPYTAVEIGIFSNAAAPGKRIVTDINMPQSERRNENISLNLSISVSDRIHLDT
jgi:hypothetical protein